jgi:ribosome-binding factor A
LNDERIKKMNERMDRISEEVRKELSSIIQNDIKDPRLPKIVSILNVAITKDMKFAKVYVSVLGNEEDKKNALAALKSAAGFVRRELGHRVKIRNTPELHFVIDSSIEHGMYITKLIDETIKHDEEGK